MKSIRTCTITGCGRPLSSATLCISHQRRKANNDPNWSTPILSKSEARTSHGHNKVGNRTPEYGSWAAMLTRCRNKNNPGFKNYGGRGITVCERWMDFSNFLADMGLRPSMRHSLERKNNEGNYEPGNCKWATRAEQANNKRNNRIIEFNGLALTVSNWARRIGIKEATLFRRLDTGKKSLKDALTP